MCVFLDDGIVTHTFDGSISPAQGHRNGCGLLKQTVQFPMKLGQFPIHGWSPSVRTRLSKPPRRGHIIKDSGILPLTFFGPDRCRQKLTCTRRSPEVASWGFVSRSFSIT